MRGLESRVLADCLESSRRLLTYLQDDRETAGLCMGGDLLKAYLEYAEAACQCAAEIRESLQMAERMAVLEGMTTQLGA